MKIPDISIQKRKIILVAANATTTLFVAIILIYVSVFLIVKIGGSMYSPEKTLYGVLNDSGINTAGDFIRSSVPSAVVVSNILAYFFIMRPFSKKLGLEKKEIIKYLVVSAVASTLVLLAVVSVQGYLSSMVVIGKQ